MNDENIKLSKELRSCRDHIAELTNENNKLKFKLSAHEAGTQATRVDITSTSSESRDMKRLPQEITPNNRYSRLMALQKMGVVKNYEEIVNLSIIIIGVGGVGSVAAEMLCRCGIGELILIDNDTVEMANMNRMFYHPHQCGEDKVLAAKSSLQLINSDVKVRTYNLDITKLENYDLIINIITGSCQDATDTNRAEISPTKNKRVNLIMSCVDNFSARMSINQLCLDANQNWIEAGLSENAISGHIQMMKPGATACFACAPPLVVATGQEDSLKKEGVCAASLPTTSAIIAGIMTQNALKYLLDFGEVSQVLAYNSLNDYFPRYALVASPYCTSELCLKRQQEVKENKQVISEEVQNLANSENLIIEEPNAWNIVVVDEVDNSTLTTTNNIHSTSNTSQYGMRNNVTTNEASIVDNLNLQAMSNNELSELLKNL